jgi:hypothetical protein
MPACRSTISDTPLNANLSAYAHRLSLTAVMLVAVPDLNAAGDGRAGAPAAWQHVGKPTHQGYGM